MKKKILLQLAILLLFVGFIILPLAVSASSGFADVPTDAWYSDGIDYVNSKGLMTGYQGERAGELGPLDNVTRAQFATIIYRLADSPQIDYEAMFPDVPNNKYYSLPVTWCAKNNIITGYTAGDRAGYFGSSEDDLIERQQVCTILYRYAKEHMNVDASEQANYSDAHIIDADVVSEYAKMAVSWCVEKGILTGKDQKNGTYLIDPKGKATRAEAATIIKRFVTNVVDSQKDQPEPDKGGNASNTSMKLYINDLEIPVTWENNDSVSALMEEAARGDITVAMSMYSNNEQFGPLGRTYSSNDVQTTTHNGDIVLYNSSNIVVFYGSNTWSYTRLGKMNLSESEVTALLSNGNVVLKITRNS